MRGVSEPATMAEWLATRPASVQALAVEFPPRSQMVVNGEPWYVVAYGEMEDGLATLQMSKVDPVADYDVSIESRFTVCPLHFRRFRASR